MGVTCGLFADLRCQRHLGSKRALRSSVKAPSAHKWARDIVVAVFCETTGKPISCKQNHAKRAVAR